MARNEVHVDATPEEVFAVLADPASYADWVVGAKHMRDADPTWPAPGARLYHTIGVGPFEIKDSTSVVERDEPHRLVLDARAGPVGRARITLAIEPEAEGARITMVEVPTGGPAAQAWGSVLRTLMRGRNAESLRRLKRIAEGKRSR